MFRVCLVEDEQSLIELISLNLEMEGYAVHCFTDGQKALEVLSEPFHYDLIILDVMLPNVNGFDLCREVRKHAATPILFLSAKGTTSDRVAGLKLGANDYLAKPFDLEELLLKVQILTQGLRGQEAQKFMKIGEFRIEFTSFNVQNGEGQDIHQFSKREIELLELFHEKEGKVVSRNEILDRVWGADQYPTSRTIDNYILVFRKLFEKDPRNPKHFFSIRGVGYKFLS
ncbi:MAG: response regulator transcription factor [Crocinitomicaceae bacterium]|jgi:two-component system alkaline phosphatase synthesis response regulator PhoP